MVSSFTVTKGFSFQDWLDCQEHLDGAIILDGLDEAVIGWTVVSGHGSRLVYDVELIIKRLVERDGMSEEDAVEFFDFNIDNSYGFRGPLFLSPRW
tara:strand:+ start:231 stop:518 length:288 start_codon:yes stop_codon:yes gene_type:complete